MNKIMLTGVSARDVTLEQSKNGMKFARINLAVKRVKSDITDWFMCVCFGALAEKVASVYVKKGTKVMISGRMEFSETEKNGVKEKHHSVMVDELEILSEAKKKEESSNLEVIDDDDFPF